MQHVPTQPLRETEGAFASRRDILERLQVSEDTYNAVRRIFPVRWPRYYLDLADTHPAVARMGTPTSRELVSDPGDLADPVSDQALRPHPFVVRKHRDRVILLTTKKCHFYCRFCFRRDEPFQQAGEPTREDWEGIFAFLAAHPEIEEPILSGGDPLTLSDDMLAWIGTRLTAIASVRRWRIHTRAPVHHPHRVTPDLVAALSQTKPLTVVTHFNSAAEVTAETARVADLFHTAGIALKNQAVLLAGVNNDPAAQTLLWQAMEAHQIAPHYLHHPDRAAGNAAFRVTIAEGRALFQALRARCTAPLPAYVLDLPDGRGKIPVPEMTATSAHLWTYTHPDGTVSVYRDTRDTSSR